MLKKAYFMLLIFLVLPLVQSNVVRGQIFGEGKIPKPKIDRLESRLKHSTQEKNNKPDKYALLICGKLYDSRDREVYQANLSIASQVLVENGFSPDKIFIIDDQGYDIFLYPIDGPANEKNINALFEYLPKVIDDQDTLFVYVTGHGIWGRRGNKKDKDSKPLSIIIIDTIYKDQEMFAKFLEKTNPKRGILLFDQCYSGGFAKETGKKNFIAIAASEAGKESFSEPHQSFGGYFMKAFRDKENSDTGQDGMVSIAEAFEYAKKRDSQKKKQNPFIQSDLDPKTVFLQ